MALTDDDLGKIAGLLAPLKLELSDIKQEISDFRAGVNAQFNEVQSNFESLFARDEKREQEYIALHSTLILLLHVASSS
jgi:hypothetical protein